MFGKILHLDASRILVKVRIPLHIVIEVDNLASQSDETQEIAQEQSNYRTRELFNVHQSLR